MDSTHLHLILNDFPIIGTIVGTGIMAYGYFTQSEATKKAALWTWAVMALIAIPVFLTGEPAEESVEGLAGVSEAIIEQHEEAAELAIWVMEALGLLSYPNPVKDAAHLMLPEPMRATIRVCDVAGRALRSMETDGGKLVEIPVEGLPTATYLVQVVLENGQTWAGKMQVE
ncbi:MAG: T9SS type A sorting domain-containing protein [Saprospiraceae bacterium]